MSRVTLETWRAFCDDPSETSFQALYDQTNRLVYTLCVRILRDETEARDAFQTTYCRLLALARDERQSGRVEDVAATVCRLAVREADALRHRRARRARKEVAVGSLPLGEASNPEPEEQLSRAQIRERVERAVDTLPERYRVPIMLHYFDGLTHAEVAAALGLPRSTVSNRLARALKRLEPAMRRLGLAETAAVVGVVLTSTALLSPPPALSASHVWAHIRALSVSEPGALGTASSMASAGGALLALMGTGITKTKIAVIGTISVVGIAALITAGALLFPERDPAGVATPAIVGVRAPVVPGGSEPMADKVAAGKTAANPTETTDAGRGGTTVFGTISIGETGAPAAGATVLLMPGMRRTTADDDGSYEFAEVKDAMGVVVAFVGPYVSHLRQRDARPMPIKKDERNGPYDLSLRRGLEMRGRVVDHESGEPIPGAVVSITLLAERTARTDARGNYGFVGLPAMRLRVDVVASGYARARILFEPQEGGENFCDFDLDPEGTVNVLVTDESGAPLDDTKVSFFFEESFAGWNLGGATDAQGRVRLTGISARKPPPLLASRKGYELVAQVAPEFLANTRETAVTLVMRTPRSDDNEDFVFVGQVTDARGAPISGARIQWSDKNRPNSGDMKTKTNQEGRYRLAFAKNDGRSWLHVSAKGWAPAWRRGVAPGSAAAPTVVDFRLEKGHWIEGVVVDPHGKPVAGAMVCPYRPPEDTIRQREIPGQPGPMNPFKTAADGSFRIDGLPDGDVQLRLWRHGLSDIRGLVRPVDEKTTIVMKEAGVIRGRIVDGETGEPVPEFTVKVSGGGVSVTRHGPGQRIWSTEGRFTLGDLNQDFRYEVIIEARGYPPLRRQGILARAPGSDEEAIFTLTEGNVVSGVVVDATTGQSIEGAAVIAAVVEHGLYDWSGLLEGKGSRYRQVSHVRTAGDGSFRIEEGTEREVLFVRAAGFARRVLRPEDRTVCLDRKSGRLKIRLQPGSSIAGAVFKGHAASSGVSVAVTYLGTPGYALGAVKTDENGAFRLVDLASGTYRVSLYRREGNSSFAWLSRKLVVRAGEEATISIGKDLGSHMLSGRVLDEAGEPVEGARVRLAPLFKTNYTSFNDYSNADGLYRLEQLPAGTYRVDVSKDIHDPRRYRQLRTGSRIEVAGDVEHDFAFAPTRRVVGRILPPRNDGGMNFGNAFLERVVAPRMRLNTDSDRPADSGWCQVSDGRLEFEGWYRGMYTLAVTGKLGDKRTAKARLHERLELDNTEADVDLGELTMPPVGLSSFDATVLQADGAPFAGALLSLAPEFTWSYTRFSATAPDDGHCRVDGLRNGTYTATVTKPRRQGGVSSQLTATVVINGATSHTFRFQEEHAVTARIVLGSDMLGDGTVLSNAALHRVGWDSRSPHGPDGMQFFRNGDVDGDTVRFVGRFRGPYTIGFSFRTGQKFVNFRLPRIFELDNFSGDQDLGEIVVPLADAGTVPLRLTVNSGEAPPPFATACLFRDSNREVLTLAGLSLQEEFQELHPILPGTYELAITAPGYRCEPAFLRITVGAGEISPQADLTLTPHGVVSGTAVPGNGSWRQISVREVRLEGMGLSRVLRPRPGIEAPTAHELLLDDKDRLAIGTFKFVDLPAGSYEVTIEADGRETTVETVEVRRGRLLSLVFPMKRS